MLSRTHRTVFLKGTAYETTATAVTPCSLHRLERTDLEVAMEQHPVIRKRLEENSEFLCSRDRGDPRGLLTV